MNSLIKHLASSRLFKSDFDYLLVRASMVFIFLIFGYQKWLQYKLIIGRHGPKSDRRRVEMN